MRTTSRSSRPAPEIADVLAGVRRLVAVLHRSARGVERRTGVTNAQLFLMQALADGPRPIAELSTAAMIDRSAVSIALKRLVARGLVSRRPHPVDARRVEFRLTASGRARLKRAPVPTTTQLMRVLDSLDARRRRALARELHLLADAIGAPAAPPMLFE